LGSGIRPPGPRPGLRPRWGRGPRSQKLVKVP
jgi:hypothetical protein